MLYARGRAHRELLQREHPPNWARSGQDSGHERALSLTFGLSSQEHAALLGDLESALDTVSTRSAYTGLPPSLLYSRFDTRLEYLLCMLQGHSELVKLLKLVVKMVCF